MKESDMMPDRLAGVVPSVAVQGGAGVRITHWEGIKESERRKGGEDARVRLRKISQKRVPPGLIRTGQEVFGLVIVMRMPDRSP